MKPLSIRLLFVALLLTTMVAQAQNKVMQVHSGNGVVYALNASQVDSITFAVPVGAPITPILIAQDNLYGTGKEQKQNTVITTKLEWDALLAVMSSPNPMPSLDEIDFEQFQVIAVIDAVRSSAGWSIDITDITEYDDKIVVTYSNLSAGGIATVLTQPYHIVKISKSDKKIEFVDKTLFAAKKP